MAANIWVVAEAWKGNICENTFELLALGRELAEHRGVSLESLLLGHGVRYLATQLGAADRVFVVDDPALKEATAETYCHVLSSIAAHKKPQCILMPLSNVAADVVGQLPARLEAPFINNCADVKAVGDSLEAKCLLYGGKMDVTAVPIGEPCILGVLPGARSAEEGRTGGSPQVEEVTVDLPATQRVVFKSYIEPEAGDVDITQQEVLVSVGRGIQTEDNIELAEELAGALGGAVCGSRPVIDQGWLSLSRQVGKSGAIVKPKLYVAAGISGAPEHVEGMKDAELIIAINTDPDAPIFNVAHFGVTEDALDVLAALTERVKAHAG
jgi:electron transfer flavoprotein alpha subunit